MSPTELMQRVYARPPRCLQGYRLTTHSPSALRVAESFFGNLPDYFGMSEPGVSETVVAFEIHHPAKDELPRVIGYYLDERWPHSGERVLVSPLSIQWAPSGQLTELFDGTQHGYNPENDLGSVHYRSSGLQEEWTAPQPCNADYRLVVCVSYSPEIADDMTPDETDRFSDYFDLFLLAVHCLGDDRVIFITQFKCS